MYEYKLYVYAYFSMHARLCISSLSNLPHTIKKRSHTYNALTIIQSGIWFVIHYIFNINAFFKTLYKSRKVMYFYRGGIFL